MAKIMDYSQKLQFEEEPNYKHIQKLIKGYFIITQISITKLSSFLYRTIKLIGFPKYEGVKNRKNK